MPAGGGHVRADRTEGFGTAAEAPRQLALINATAILVIAAAILALVAMGRIDHLAGRVARTMTDGADEVIE